MVDFWRLLFANGFLLGLSGWHFFESRQAYRGGFTVRLIGVNIFLKRTSHRYNYIKFLKYPETLLING